MEIFTTNFSSALSYNQIGNQDERQQTSHEPLDRLTADELDQLKGLREEIEARVRQTPYEKRYASLLKYAEQEFCGTRTDVRDGITRVRVLLKVAKVNTGVAEQSINMAFLAAAIAKTLKL